METKEKIDNKELLATLSRLENLLSCSKTVMNCDDLVAYTGYAKSTIYKLVYRKEIPYFKPTGKQLFFSKDKIDAWLTSKSVKSKFEIAEIARNRAFLK